MPLLIDSASTARTLREDEFRHWAASHAVFISSEMRELAGERQAVARALRELGIRVILFEDLGGRDEGPEQAYLDGVAEAQIYLGIVGDRYGTMLSSGRSPTHEEYRQARRLGRRISVWVARDGSNRQGDARDFVEEVRLFHTTGSYSGADDLAERVARRMREIAAEEDSPWVKLDDVVLRAEHLRDAGTTLTITTAIRDPRVLAAIESLRPDTFARAANVSVSTANRAGTASIETVVSEATSASLHTVTVEGRVEWNEGRGGAMDAGAGGLSADDLVEQGLRVGVLGEALPQQLSAYEFMLDTGDPLAPLSGHTLTPATSEAVARLLIVERLMGSGHASSVDDFALGPQHQGERQLRLAYTEPRRYSNVEPGQRIIEGSRRS